MAVSSGFETGNAFNNQSHTDFVYNRFKRSSSADGLNFSNNQYIFFDIKTWECRVFSNMHAAGNFSNGLLHEDSVRVKFMNSS